MKADSRCNGCSADMVYACSHEFGDEMPPCAKESAPSASTNSQSDAIALRVGNLIRSIAACGDEEEIECYAAELLAVIAQRHT